VIVGHGHLDVRGRNVEHLADHRPHGFSLVVREDDQVKIDPGGPGDAVVNHQHGRPEVRVEAVRQDVDLGAPTGMRCVERRRDDHAANPGLELIRGHRCSFGSWRDASR
jgi:hypothetical protein